MKKINKVIFSLLVVLSMFMTLVGCNKKEEVNIVKKEISFIAPSGVPATAISKMIKENIQIDNKYLYHYLKS